jgi:hypothetical protein
LGHIRNHLFGLDQAQMQVRDQGQGPAALVFGVIQNQGAGLRNGHPASRHHTIQPIKLGRGEGRVITLEPDPTAFNGSQHCRVQPSGGCDRAHTAVSQQTGRLSRRISPRHPYHHGTVVRTPFGEKPYRGIGHRCRRSTSVGPRYWRIRLRGAGRNIR